MITISNNATPSIIIQYPMVEWWWLNGGSHPAWAFAWRVGAPGLPRVVVAELAGGRAEAGSSQKPCRKRQKRRGKREERREGREGRGRSRDEPDGAR